jgi:hypothetical protein
MTITFYDRLKNNKNNLAKSLGFSLKTKISLSLLKKIINSKVGETIVNKSKKGNKNIKITIMLKNNARDSLKFYKILNKINKLYKNEKGKRKVKR